MRTAEASAWGGAIAGAWFRGVVELVGREVFGDAGEDGVGELSGVVDVGEDLILFEDGDDLVVGGFAVDGAEPAVR
jgi:hypothetical protein